MPARDVLPAPAPLSGRVRGALEREAAAVKRFPGR
jgi:hypothetical protein